MRLVTIRPLNGDAADLGIHQVAVVLGSGRLLTLGTLAKLTPDRLAQEIEELSLATVVSLDPSLKAIREAVDEIGAEALQEVSIDPASVRIAPPVPRPGKIVGVGYNYLDHIREQGLERPERPVLFTKMANSVVGDGDPIRKPAGTHALDFEAELAVVIGRRTSGVSVDDALRYVAGYTAANDVTARDWQGQARALRPGEKGDGQWLRAKGSDTFLPLGPTLVPIDDLGNGRGFRVQSWLTAASGPHAGEPVQFQDGSTEDMIFGVPELVSMISQEVTLDPGDIIVTGTPSGVGVFREPPVFLKPGDIVTVEVERIGRLTSPVVDEFGRAPEGSPAARALGASSAPESPEVGTAARS